MSLTCQWINTNSKAAPKTKKTGVKASNPNRCDPGNRRIIFDIDSRVNKRFIILLKSINACTEWRFKPDK